MKLLEKTLYTTRGLLVAGILAFNVVCSPVAAPTSTPIPTRTIELQSQSVQPTSTPTRVVPTPTSTPPPATVAPRAVPTTRPTLALPISPTPTPTQTAFRSIKFDELLDFVENNYFKVPSTLFLTYGPHDDFIAENNFNQDIPFIKVFSLQDSIGGYIRYDFFYTNPSITSRFEEFKQNLRQRGWKPYKTGLFGRSSRFYDTWINFESNRFVAISDRTDRDNLSEGVDSYLLNKERVRLVQQRSFVKELYPLIPREFDSRVVAIRMGGEAQGVTVVFDDSEGRFSIGAEQKAGVGTTGGTKIGGYDTQVRYWESSESGRKGTDIAFYCRPNLHCLVRGRWELKPSSIGIESRFESYLSSIKYLFDSQK